ncbi:uncharacterized protein METZ01_LOCUS479578 [marine metagenome]|uniref:Uncharacterized protein n=1 Tax=marine metagenome TaxID=408172 RepID=A0A383C3G3_9ZZZZ
MLNHVDKMKGLESIHFCGNGQRSLYIDFEVRVLKSGMY